MKDFTDKVAVITGAASGLGKAFALYAHRQRMRLVLADVQADALRATQRELEAQGAQLITVSCDVAVEGDVARLTQQTYEHFGAAHLLFNNAGVAGHGGYLWEASETDWRWVMGVNLMGVAHGIRHFVPRWIKEGAGAEQAHVVNTASVAGWVCAPLMGTYNASKSAVVSLSETLYNDLRLAGFDIGVSLLCPAFVPTGIAQSQRNRPRELAHHESLTASQRAAHVAGEQAVAAGKISADEVAALTFDAIRAGRFHIFTHPQILPAVEARLHSVLRDEPPADPYAAKPKARPKVED